MGFGIQIPRLLEKKAQVVAFSSIAVALYGYDQVLQPLNLL